MSQQKVGVNRAKQWQVALFPFNNAATNVYFAFYNYFTYFALMHLTGADQAKAIGGTIISGVLALAISTFTSLFVPAMRIFDGITDPILGGLMDKTKTRFGKFRPFMVIGNAMLAFSIILMMVVSRFIPFEVSALRWVMFILSYVIYVMGYTCQCAVTKAGQTCLTNDPKQRSQFVIWNMIGQIGSIVLVNIMAGGILTNDAICAKGLLVYESETGMTLTALLEEFSSKNIIPSADVLSYINAHPTSLYAYTQGAAYGVEFYNIMVPFVIIISAIYTIMAVAAISEKDKPAFWGVSEKQATMKDYVGIIKGNKEMRWLVLSSGLNKLASTVATSSAVMFLLFGCLMGNYNELFIPFYGLCFVFMGVFFMWGSKTAGAKGQKRGVTQFTIFAFIFYIGVLVLLCLFSPDNPAFKLDLYEGTLFGPDFRLTINAYTIIFIIFYGCGYGAFNCCDNLTIPMIADCTDYETYRSGNYVPGIMGTVFSLIDKLISSLQTLLLTVFIVYLVPNLNALPAENTQYMEGMKLSCIICFCVLPMLSWLITTICMTKYSLSGKKLQEIQAVNAVRKAAVQGGMSMEEAMDTWKTIDQVPSRFVHDVKEAKKENILDKVYNKIFTKCENVTTALPSSNAVEIPEKFQVKGE